MASGYSIEHADMPSSGPELQALWVNNLVGHNAESARTKWHLGYADNPAGPGAVLMLMASESPAAQGTLGLHPRRYLRGATIVQAVALADFVVNPAHRSLGPAMMLVRAAAQLGREGYDFAFGFPNAKAAPVFGVAGFKQIGVLRRFAKPLGSIEQLYRRLPRWAARRAAPLIDACLRLADTWRGLATRPRLVCLPSPWSDAALDSIWAQRPQQRLLSERTGAMLHWRFGAPGRPDWQVCVARDANHHPQGYVAWRRLGDSIEVGDFFTRDPLTQTAALMMAFTRLVRPLGAHSISLEFFGPDSVKRQLLAAGLAVRPQQHAVFVDLATAGHSASPEGWYLTRFDSDAD